MFLLVTVCMLLQEKADPPTVGMWGRIDNLVLPGSELAAEPLEDRKRPIVLRIVAVYRHGTAHRYDLLYYGLEPGSFDLKDYLRRKDGSPAGDLPAIPVTILPAYPVDDRRTVNDLDPERAPSVGGYTVRMIVFGVIWAAGLLVLVFAGRKRRAGTADAESRPPTLAGLLSPLVRKAADGSLSDGEKARLERLILGFWRRRANLQSSDVAGSLKELKDHEEAGPLIRALEEWFHRPGKGGDADLQTLLKPYRDLPPDVVEEERLLK